MECKNTEKFIQELTAKLSEAASLVLEGEQLSRFLSMDIEDQITGLKVFAVLSGDGNSVAMMEVLMKLYGIVTKRNKDEL